MSTFGTLLQPKPLVARGKGGQFGICRCDSGYVGFLLLDGYFEEVGKSGVGTYV